MFDKKDMMVSLLVAENEIKEAEAKHSKSYNKLKDEFRDFINATKAITGFVGEVECKELKYKFPIGYDTGFEIDGVKVYTGDEIRLISKDGYLNGKVGIATMTEEKPYWTSNAECGYMRKSIKYEFVRHFVHYKNGDEIAKGRKGARGFVVSINR